ncbi:MAG: hypothetical protein ABSG03_19070 [Bryobacteraceae bacterium]|jgi:hypothetical protein
MELLDVWENAEQVFLTRIADCMVDFRLGDDGRIELAGMGESTEEGIMKTCAKFNDGSFAAFKRDGGKRETPQRLCW